MADSVYVIPMELIKVDTISLELIFSSKTSTALRGFAKLTNFYKNEITIYVGAVQVSLGKKLKIVQN